jgi:hypothetical protein
MNHSPSRSIIAVSPYHGLTFVALGRCLSGYPEHSSRTYGRSVLWYGVNSLIVENLQQLKGNTALKV